MNLSELGLCGCGRSAVQILSLAESLYIGPLNAHSPPPPSKCPRDPVCVCVCVGLKGKQDGISEKKHSNVPTLVFVQMANKRLFHFKSLSYSINKNRVCLVLRDMFLRVSLYFRKPDSTKA